MLLWMRASTNACLCKHRFQNNKKPLVFEVVWKMLSYTCNEVAIQVKVNNFRTTHAIRRQRNSLFTRQAYNDILKEFIHFCYQEKMGNTQG